MIESAGFDGSCMQAHEQILRPMSKLLYVIIISFYFKSWHRSLSRSPRPASMTQTPPPPAPATPCSRQLPTPLSQGPPRAALCPQLLPPLSHSSHTYPALPLSLTIPTMQPRPPDSSGQSRSLRAGRPVWHSSGSPQQHARAPRPRPSRGITTPAGPAGAAPTPCSGVPCGIGGACRCSPRRACPPPSCLPTWMTFPPPTPRGVP